MNALGWALVIAAASIFLGPLCFLLLTILDNLLETWLRTCQPARCPHCGRRPDGPRHEELISDPRGERP